MSYRIIKDKTMVSKAFAIALTLFIVAQASLASPDVVMVNSPWIREAPPSAKVLAGYLELHNTGKKTLTLVQASCADFDKVEIHTTTNDNGMMRMEALSAVDIGKNQKVQFQPGGIHLMLISPKRKLKAGDEVVVSLSFKSGFKKDVTMTVKKFNPE